MTLNELTLGIERLARIGDAKAIDEMRKQLADLLGVGSLGKFSLRAPQPTNNGA